jgi:hypothetical protein
MSDDRGVNTWQVKRPLWWGLLLLLDRDTSEVPESTDAVVSTGTEGLAVKVLHAQDVDLSGFDDHEVVPLALVQIEINVGAAPPGDVAFSGEIDVPSGVLSVGDAEQEDALQIGPGRWAVQVDYAPPEHAERVRVWLQPR